MFSKKKFLLDDNNSLENQFLIRKKTNSNEENDDFLDFFDEDSEKISSGANPKIKKKKTSNFIFAGVSNLFAKEKKLTQLWLISIAYLLFAIIEVIGAIYSNSVFMITDVAHSFSDCFGFFICIVSIYVTKKGTTSEMSFGFHRAEIIGTLVSVTLIWGFSFWIIYASSLRVIYIERVNGLMMFLFAIFGLFFNLIMGGILMWSGVGHSASFKNKGEKNRCDKHEHGTNELSCIGIKSTFTHAFKDALQSCVMILNGVIFYFFEKAFIIDPLCALCFIIVMLIADYKVLNSCIGILMEGSPVEYNLEDLGNDLLTVKGVVEVHDLHVWSISLGKNSMSCHLITTCPQLSLKKASDLIEKKYNISHSTIQVELDEDNIKLLCNAQTIHKPN